jgi:hypothetical protein
MAMMRWISSSFSAQTIAAHAASRVAAWDVIEECGG